MEYPQPDTLEEHAHNVIAFSDAGQVWGSGHKLEHNQDLYCAMMLAVLPPYTTWLNYFLKRTLRRNCER